MLDHAPAEPRRLMLDLEDRGTQTDATSKPGSPATPKRPMQSARNVVRQAPVPRPHPQPQPQQPSVPVAVKREPKPVPQPRPPPSVHVATAAGEEVVENLPAARTGLPQARPTLPMKRQQQNLLREIYVPTTLLKRRGHAAENSTSAAPLPPADSSTDGGATDGSAAEGPKATAEVPSSVGTAAPAATAPAATAPAATAPAATAAKPRPASAQANRAATPPQLGIIASGSHAATSVGKPPTGVLKAPVSSHATPHATTGAKTAAAPAAVAGAAAAGLSMLGNGKPDVGGMMAKSVKPHAAAPAGQPATKTVSVPQTAPAPTPKAMLPERVAMLPERVAMLPERVAMPTGEAQDADVADFIPQSAEARPVTAMTDEPEALSTPGLQTPQEALPPADDVTLPLDRPASSSEPAQPEPEQAEGCNTGPGEEVRPESAASSVSTAEPLDDSLQVLDDLTWPGETLSDQVVQIHRAAIGRVHRNTAHLRPPSPLQTQISSVRGSAPGGRADRAPAQPGSNTAGSAQRAQHGRTGKVPPLNMTVMRALKQQVSGLVPLDSRGSSKAARTVLQQTAPASQRALSSRLPVGAVSPKAESMVQLTPLANTPLHSRSLPDISPIHASRGSALQPASQPQAQPQPQPQTAALLQSMLPGIVSAATPRQILPLDATVQLIGDIYDSKSVADLAALRQQLPCRPMQEFAQHYLQTRFGTGAGGSWQGAWKQLETAVKMHGADDRVVAFAATCGMLPGGGEAQRGAASSAQVR